jgi:hypothetical protein
MQVTAPPSHTQSFTKDVDTHIFKVIEAFSHAACEELAQRHGEQYLKPEVIYGFTAFVAAMHSAVEHLPNSVKAA